MARHGGTNNDLLAMALVGYEAQKAKIDAAIAELRVQLGHRASNVPANSVPKRSTMSAAGRNSIAAAQRKRWAAIRNAKAQPAKPKRKLSAAARKSIGDAARKRWAAVRKAAAKKTRPVAKAATATA